MNAIWGAASRPKQSQMVSGDAFVVLPFSDNRLLVAVIDGLGGGEEAHNASEKAVAILHQHPGLGLKDLAQKTHLALHNTRGAVAALMQFDLGDRRISFVGVGNVGVYAHSTSAIRPISKNGILGYRLPVLLEMNYNYNSGDTFVLYSDGVSSRFSFDSTINYSVPPQDLADSILRAYGKSNDDATIVVVRGF